MVIEVSWSFYYDKYSISMGVRIFFFGDFSSRKYCVKSPTKYENVFTFPGIKKYAPIPNTLYEYRRISKFASNTNRIYKK